MPSPFSNQSEDGQSNNSNSDHRTYDVLPLNYSQLPHDSYHSPAAYPPQYPEPRNVSIVPPTISQVYDDQAHDTYEHGSQMHLIPVDGGAPKTKVPRNFQ